MEVNQKYFYIGNDLDNSFEFKISKIHDTDIIIVTGEGKDTNVWKVKRKHLEDKFKQGQIKGLRN
jgi:hypothetical protein